MKWVAVVGTLLGLLLAGVLFAYNDAPRVFHLVVQVGWGVGLVVAVRAVLMFICGVAWSEAVRPIHLLPRWVFVFLRWIREAINQMLPVASVGGDLVGGRLLTFWKVPGGLAGASILVDVLLQVAGQFLFTLAGVAALIVSQGPSRLSAWGLRMVAVALPVVVAFYVAQRRGLFKLAERVLMKTGLGKELGLQENLQEIYSHTGAVARSFALHLAAWIVGVGEVWIGLRLLRYPCTFVEALIIDSLVQAARSVGFVVPSGVGLQEGAFFLIGQFFGIAPPAALALSLIKRVPSVTLGIPGLGAWHWLERRRLGARGWSWRQASTRTPFQKAT